MHSPDAQLLIGVGVEVLAQLSAQLLVCYVLLSKYVELAHVLLGL